MLRSLPKLEPCEDFRYPLSLTNMRLVGDRMLALKPAKAGTKVHISASVGSYPTNRISWTVGPSAFEAGF